MSNLGSIELQNPYLDANELESDIILAAGSVKEFFGDVPDDFVPPRT